ncbi:MAG TPA: hypothetical protein VJ696_10685 [Rhodanobacteraceae bacterium]|nr:hypothetical protein [Rhodanobacteraceae bacterium]
MRRVAAALAVLACWTVLLLWAAGADWRAPFAPAERREFRGGEFTSVFGTGAVEAGTLRVEATGADFTSLQSLAPSDLDAAAFTTLRYRFADFPRTLELSLVFRTADDPEVVAISLPWPGAGERTFDLARIPEWRGRIVEIGFAEFPVAQLVPPAQGFRPFAIVEADLWSRSWRGDLAALATDWFGAWPWTQRSVHALGRDTDTPRAESLVLCVALAAGAALAGLALAFGWRDRRVAAGGAIAVAVAWIALDVAWQAGLWGRLETTRAVYAPLSWIDRQHTIADTGIADAADRLRMMLRGEPKTARILVYADSTQGYELLRFIWHLLPRNVAVYAYASPFVNALPDRCLIVFLDSDAWRTDPSWRRLLAHSEHVAPPRSIYSDSFEDSPLVVFRFHRGR